MWKKETRTALQACAHTLSQAPESLSISGHNIQRFHCQWQCYRLQGTGNPLTLCPCVSYAAANAYYKCLKGIINITVSCASLSLHACFMCISWINCWTHWGKCGFCYYHHWKCKTWRQVFIPSVSVAPSFAQKPSIIPLPYPQSKVFATTLLAWFRQ